MGSIYQRVHERIDPDSGQKAKIPAGPFWIKYYQNGQVYRESSRSDKHHVAERLLKKREGEIAENRFQGLDYAKTTIADLVKLLLQDYEANRRRSLRDARRTVKVLQDFFGANTRASDLTTNQITEYRLCRQAADLSDSSINRELAALRRMYRLGENHEPPLVARVPRIALVREDNVRTGFFEPDEFTAMRDALPDHAKVPLIIGYYTGMRLGEILGLQWPQVDLIRGLIRLEPGRTKNKEGRTVPLLGELRETLERWRLETMAAYPGCPWVCHHEGEQLKSLKKAWGTACKRVGLKGKLFHDLRRSAVRNLIRAGVPQAVAKKISGHKTDSVFDRYNIVSEHDLVDAIGKVERYQKGQAAHGGHNLGTIAEVR